MRLRKELKQEDYPLKIIRDLGMVEDEKGNRYRKAIFECPECSEGIETIVYNVRKGATKRCDKCRVLKQHTHSKSKTINYHRWQSMKGRCLNKKHRDYHRYGERGITIQSQWINSYESYETYILSLPNAMKEGLTVDRIENDNGYKIGNLRWANAHVQSANQRIISSSGLKGTTKIGEKFIGRIAVNNKQIYLGTFNTELEGAKAYDKYVIENKLEHTINGV